MREVDIFSDFIQMNGNEFYISGITHSAINVYDMKKNKIREIKTGIINPYFVVEGDRVYVNSIPFFVPNVAYLSHTCQYIRIEYVLVEY